MQVERDSSSDEVLTASRSAYLREIHRQIDYSAKLLCKAERINTGEAARNGINIFPAGWKGMDMRL
jgi:hypothetical protein